ncbi:MAG TPA: L-threonylcarbamoyladenylate synthase [Alphaproteobacteria bacterium]|nr:L-threonylcarbamoyladenylate synthase [Alphaproteobacteria bacterium]
MQREIMTEKGGLRANLQSASAAAIGRAAALIRAGGLVAFPTETVYGLGADATNSKAVARIFEAKGRPSFNPLIVHVGDIRIAGIYAPLDDRAEDLAAAFWPGPLTLVLPRRPNSAISELVSAGLGSVAIRMPAHPVARELLRAAGRPIAAPSANRSGHVSPTAPIHVAEELADEVDMILAAGRSEVGLESTIIDLSRPKAVLLRPGAVTREQVEAVIGPVDTASGDPDRPTAPGQLRRHYAPSTRLRLNAETAEPGEALLAFGPALLAGRRADRVLNLSERGDPTEAAANLFAMLRTLDAGGHRGIAVMPIPEAGLGAAINDRLGRAAAPADE